MSNKETFPRRFNVMACGELTQVEALSAYDALDVARPWFYDRGIRDEAVSGAEVWPVEVRLIVQVGGRKRLVVSGESRRVENGHLIITTPGLADIVLLRGTYKVIMASEEKAS